MSVRVPALRLRVYPFLRAPVSIASTGAKIIVRLLTDKATKKFRGLAFVDVPDEAALAKAIALHRTVFKGRRISVEQSTSGGGKSEVRPPPRGAAAERLSPCVACD